MFSPNKWIKPRLKPLCVGFGLADMTLVLLSIFSWYFFFSIWYHAQSNELIKSYAKHKETFPGFPAENPKDGNLKLLREEQEPATLRIQRILRVCGFNFRNENPAGPAALIGAAMGGYFILGMLLASMSFVHYPAARKALCSVTIIGEGICTVFLMTAVTLIAADEGFCPTEYYYEHFQPIVYLVVLSILFITTYKTYEVTVIIFYRMEMSKRIDHKEEEVARRRATLSSTLNETETQTDGQQKDHLFKPENQAPTTNKKDQIQRKKRRRKVSTTREVTGTKDGKPFTVTVNLE